MVVAALQSFVGCCTGIVFVVVATACHIVVVAAPQLLSKTQHAHRMLHTSNWGYVYSVLPVVDCRLTIHPQFTAA